MTDPVVSFTAEGKEDIYGTSVKAQVPAPKRREQPPLWAKNGVLLVAIKDKKNPRNWQPPAECLISKFRIDIRKRIAHR